MFVLISFQVNKEVHLAIVFIAKQCVGNSPPSFQLFTDFLISVDGAFPEFSKIIAESDDVAALGVFACVRTYVCMHTVV